MDELDRLFRCVVRAVRDQSPETLSRPVEVAELLQFVPYRAVREELGVDTNDDYAHAVTRLLSGERGYVFVDDLMQDDLQSELASTNPDLAAYRAYANARVTLAQEQVRQTLDALGPATAPVATATGVDLPPRAATTPPTAAPRRGSFSPSRASVLKPLDPAAETPKRVGRPGCKYCGQSLPEGREVHFCPHCGQNLLARRCAACSAELDTSWKFCVACGRAAAS